MTRIAPCMGEERRLDLLTIAGITVVLWIAIIGMAVVVL